MKVTGMVNDTVEPLARYHSSLLSIMVTQWHHSDTLNMLIMCSSKEVQIGI